MKEPQDHKTKAVDTTPDEAFSFKGGDGKTYTLAPTMTKLTPRYLRTHRDSDVAFTYDLFEELADTDTLEAFDALSFKDNAKVLARWREHVQAHLGAAMGESKAS